MKILVTGSEGNIGRRLVPYLRRLGHHVRRTDIRQAFGDDYTLANICSPLDLSEVFARYRPEVVFHCAAMVSRITCEASPAVTVEVNLAGVENVIQLCVANNAKMIYFSTSEVYGNIGGLLSEDTTAPQPNNLYGLTKLLGERLVEYAVANQSLKAVTVRPFMFYDEYEDFGVHRSAMIRFAESIIRNQAVEVHAGAHRSWLHMDDAVRALERVMHVPDYDVFNIGHSDVITMREIVTIMCDILRRDSSNYVRETPLPSKMTLVKSPDLRKMTEVLNIRPEVSLRDGIKRVLNEADRRVAIDQSVAGRSVSAAVNRVSSSSSKT